MTPEQAEERLGAVVYANEFNVVRVNARTGMLHIHRRNDNGNESLPHGYIFGGNALRLFSEVPL